MTLRDALLANTGLGANYVKAMPQYAKGSGLLESDYRLSEFGQIALQCDPMLMQLSTQWLMHYHLSAPHGPGPLFWHKIVSSHFSPANEFERGELSDQIGDLYEQSENKPLKARTAQATATIFLGTYEKPEGLGRLGILDKQADGSYRVLAPKAPSVWACAYSLVDYWRNQFSDRLTVSLDALTMPGGWSDLLMFGSSHLNDVLREMQAEGYVDVFRVSPPYQVVLLRQDVEPLLKRMYGLS
jgi:hypothetical protein